MQNARNNNHRSFFGAIDDVRVYDHALTQDEVSDLFENPTVQEQIEDLILDVDEINLASGIENALDQKLDNTLDAWDAENADQRQDVVNKLYAVINATEAQRGKKITEADADFIVDSVLATIAAIEAGSP